MHEFLISAMANLVQADPAVLEETIRWMRLPDLWVLVLVIFPLVVGIVWFFYRREIPIGKPRWRAQLAALRVLIILFVLAMLAQPVARKTTEDLIDSVFLVLIDESLSMDIADRYSDRATPEKLARAFGSSAENIETSSRYELIRRMLENEDIGFLEKLRSKGKVVVASFARTVQELVEIDRVRGDVAENPLPEEILVPYSKLRDQSRVQETRIAEALRDGVSALSGAGFSDDAERVAGVVLISDGQENSGSASVVDIARRLGERGTPVHVLGVGNPDEPKDLRLVNMDVEDIVLVDDTVPVDITVIADGYEGERGVAVRLKIDSKTEDTKFITLEGKGRRQSVRLEYRPRKAGEFTLTAEIDRLGGEIFDDNNSISKTIRVLDEKIRVLYLEYMPRWEYRYLKNALVRDPTMEAQVWLYSADPEFVQESSASVPSLRAVPSDRAELFKYHVIILGDVMPDDLGIELAALLKEFVYEGGGLICISGRHASPGRYLHSDLYSIIPVEIPERSDRFDVESRRPVSDPFKVQLTPEGKELAVMRLDSDPARNLHLWESRDNQIYAGLPPFFWYARVGKAKASTVVLARNPDDEIPSTRQGRVIFAYMNYGKGRSFFSAVDNTWRWRAGVENKYLYRFWGQIVRFVATGRLLGKTPRFAVTTDKTAYNIGEIVKVDARVFDANMKPSTEQSVTLYHQAQGREGEPPDRIELSLNEVKGQGAYEGSLSAALLGRHDIWLGSQSTREAFHSFGVEIPALESRDPRLNESLLTKIATVSGGEYHLLYDAALAAEALQGMTRQQERLVEDDDLWDESWVLLLFTGLICLEWILRKMVRLL